MAGSIGDLVIRLSADIASFQSDMGRAAHIAQRNAARIQAVFATVRTGLAALGVAAGGVGVVAMATRRNR